MLRIVVFCGGTGGKALQKGIYDLYGKDTIQLDLIVNAYDNGKSTGACRRIFKNQILGPSDVRKNQLMQFSLLHEKELKDPQSRYSMIYRMMKKRLSAPDPATYYEMARKEIIACGDTFTPDVREELLGLLSYFFFEKDDAGHAKMRETVLDEHFKDFSISNIFYASCAAMNGNSMGAAARYMARLLEIKDNVHLVSDKNLFLKAETQLGHVIGDEGDIVVWDNPKDKIVRAILCDNGQEYTPAVGEGASDSEDSIEQLVRNANILIFSSGTQWSSLIPTYMHRGFRELVRRSHAQKYLIMNNVEDHDVYGVGAEELCDILERYLNLKDMTLVVNNNACPSMRAVPEKYSTVSGELSEPGNSKHIPKRIIGAIMADYYRAALSCRHLVFDLDGTLWNERGTEIEKEIGRENLRLFEGVILTGNSVSHVQNVLSKNAPKDKRIEVFADYGNTRFSTEAPNQTEYLTDEFFLSSDLCEKIRNSEICAGKNVMLRGKTVITIKPLADREAAAERLNAQLNQYGNIVAKPAGNTSVDVTDVGYTKTEMLRRVLRLYDYSPSTVLFVGNELEQGSEETIEETGVKTLQVNDVYECYVYLRTRRFMERMALHA